MDENRDGTDATAGTVVTRMGTGTAFTVMGVQITKLARAADGSHSVFECVGRAPHGSPLHRHPWPETFIVLDGALRLDVAGDQQELHVGDSASVPSGVLHTVQAIDTRPCRYLVVSSTEGTVRAFRAIDAVDAGARPDAKTVRELYVEHGVWGKRELP